MDYQFEVSTELFGNGNLHAVNISPVLTPLGINANFEINGGDLAYIEACALAFRRGTIF